LELPKVTSYLPSETGESPLARAKDWLNVAVNLETGEVKDKSAASDSAAWVSAQRETNTMPQWAGSCWYYLRYIDPANTSALLDPEKAKYWGTPDFYIGGAEHAVLHLLYARFWHRFLFDIGVLPTPEPFQRLFHQGIILGEDGEKMSKSRGNVVNPDEVIRDHGTDALRLYLMFLGPLEAVKPWNTKNIKGISNFLRRVWRLFINEDTGALSARFSSPVDGTELDRVLHQTIKKVTEDIEALRFNTAISQLMIFLNAAEKAERIPLPVARDFLRLLAPLAPHLGEELWSRLNASPADTDASISDAGWPTYDPSKLVEDTVTIVFQVNGKLRGQIVLPKTATKDDVLAAARADENIRKFTAGKTIVKEIVVPGKLVNFVVTG
jgi:leucyl-tRNA synthetase